MSRFAQIQYRVMFRVEGMTLYTEFNHTFPEALLDNIETSRDIRGLEFVCVEEREPLGAGGYCTYNLTEEEFRKRLWERDAKKV